MPKCIVRLFIIQVFTVGSGISPASQVGARKRHPHPFSYPNIKKKKKNRSSKQSNCVKMSSDQAPAAMAQARREVLETMYTKKGEKKNEIIIVKKIGGMKSKHNNGVKEEQEPRCIEENKGKGPIGGDEINMSKESRNRSS